MTVSVNQELSPIKFCFLIKREIGSFSRASQVANCLWGGRFSPIFPLVDKFDKEFRAIFSAYQSEKEFYKNALRNFNPDIIVLEEGLSKDFASEISDNRLIVSLEELEKGILKLENTYGLTVLEIIYEIVTGMFEYKRNDDLKIHLARNPENDPLISTLFNTPITALSDVIQQSLEKRDFAKFSEVQMADLQKMRGPQSITFTDINLHGLSSQRSLGDHYEYVFIFKRDDLNSLVILWNLKAAGRRVFALPISDYSSGQIDEGIIEFYRHVEQGSFGPSVFGGPYVTRKEFTDAFTYLEKIVKDKHSGIMVTYQHWIPRFGSEMDVAQKDGVVSSIFVHQTKYEHVKTEGGYLQYDLLTAGFKATKHTHRKTHKVTSYFKYFDHLLNHPSVIDGIDSLDWIRMTDSISYEDYRVTNGGIIKFCAGDRSDIHFKVPETSEYLKNFFHKKQLKFSITPNGELTRQIFKNIGGVHGIGVFSSRGAVKVLETLENENIVGFETLLGLIKKLKPSNFEGREYEFISILLEKKIIELGALVQCMICFQRSFYSLEELSPQLICKNCRSTHSPPLSNPKESFKWNYRGIGPFSRSNKVDGLLSCFFTLSLFEHGIYAANDGITSFMNFQLQGQDNPIEVDLMVQLREESFSEDKTDLIFCECKTYKNFNQIDIDRMKALGEAYPGSILVLSTLNDKFTDDEKGIIIPLVDHFRKGHGNRPLNSILILTANELLPNKLFKPFDHFGKIHPSVRYNDYIGFLCQKSSEVYLGLKTWSDIKTEEWREMQNKRSLLGKVIDSLQNRHR